MSDYATTQTAPRTGMRFKHVLIMLLIAFVGGGAAVWWLADEYGYLDQVGPAAIESSQPQTPAPIAGNMAPAIAPEMLGGTDSRLTQINADAAAASGNAARAESLLVAFAARRAIDSGVPLGYLADQLRLRFGASQPQAVTTIISASQAPVTIEMLKTELKGLEPALLTGNSDAGIWTTVKREMSELFVLRKDGAPSPAPTQRFERAQTFVEAGNMSAAMAEVSALPGAASAQSWLVRAKRYSDARKALDRLERGALVAPIAAPVVLPPPVMDEAQPPLSDDAPVQ